MAQEEKDQLIYNFDNNANEDFYVPHLLAEETNMDFDITINSSFDESRDNHILECHSFPKISTTTIKNLTNAPKDNREGLEKVHQFQGKESNPISQVNGMTTLKKKRKSKI